MGNQMWTKQEVKRLMTLHLEGKTDEEIGKELNRTAKAVQLKRTKMVRVKKSKAKPSKQKKTYKPRTNGSEVVMLANLIVKYPWLQKYLKS